MKLLTIWQPHLMAFRITNLPHLYNAKTASLTWRMAFTKKLLCCDSAKKDPTLYIYKKMSFLSEKTTAWIRKYNYLEMLSQINLQIQLIKFLLKIKSQITN